VEANAENPAKEARARRPENKEEDAMDFTLKGM
jgi:hypothetical protein